MSEQTGDSPPPEIHEDVMAATCRALAEHGYADLTVQDIAAEADRSKSALHYHYETKQELLAALLDHLNEQFAERVRETDGECPADRLSTLLDDLLEPREEHRRLFTSLLELRAQAPYEEAFGEELVANETFVREFVTDLVAESVETGEFREVDPESTARLLLAAVRGARTNWMILDDDAETERVREALDDLVLEDLRGAEA